MLLKAALLTCILRAEWRVEHSFVRNTEAIIHIFKNAAKIDVPFFRLAHFVSTWLGPTHLLFTYICAGLRSACLTLVAALAPTNGICRVTKSQMCLTS